MVVVVLLVVPLIDPTDAAVLAANIDVKIML